MPSRVIREGLLDSAAYWSVTLEARQLYLHLLLLADDFACVSLAPVFLRRRCFDDAPSHDKIAALLQQLTDADLLRQYEVDGARYGFVPRFRQRLRRAYLRHPEPPAGLYRDDQHALELFQRIKDKAGNVPGERPTSGGQMTGTGRPEGEGEGEAKAEVEDESEGEAKAETDRSPATPLNIASTIKTLRGKGMSIADDRDRIILDWARDGFTEEWICQRSFAIADSKKKGPTVNLPLLNCIVRDPNAQPKFEVSNTNRDLGNDQWRFSEAGIQGKARELGVETRPGEDWEGFKRRIDEAIRASAREPGTTPSGKFSPAAYAKHLAGQT